MLTSEQILDAVITAGSAFHVTTAARWTRITTEGLDPEKAEGTYEDGRNSISLCLQDDLPEVIAMERDASPGQELVVVRVDPSGLGGKSLKPDQLGGQLVYPGSGERNWFRCFDIIEAEALSLHQRVPARC